MQGFVCVLLCCCVIAASGDAYGQNIPIAKNALHHAFPNTPVIALTPKKPSVAAGISCYFLADSAKNLTLNDVLTDSVSSRFQPSKQDIPSFGLVKPTYWFVLKVKNTTPLVDDWLLEIAYPPLDSIEVFTHDSSGVWSSVLVGDLMPFSQRVVQTRIFAIPLALHDTLTHHVVLRINSQSSMLVPMTLRHSTEFAENVALGSIAYGLFFGAMVALALYNGFLFVSLQSPFYGLYTLYVLAGTLYLAVLNGFASQYLWSNSPRFVNYLNAGTIGLIIFCLSLFAREFLRTKRYAPFMAKALLATMIGGAAVSLLAIVLPYQTGVQLGVAVNFITISFVVVSGALVWKRGNTSARYFFIAVSLFLTGNIIFVLKTVGILPSTPFTNHIVEIGFTLEGLLFAFSLAERYRQLRLEKEEAQQEALRIEHDAKAQLERKVQERTNELESTNTEMQRQMVILNNQAVEIEMTNVELNEKNIQLESLNREKNEFLGVAAHDLKNPLQTIIMNTSMMRRYAEKLDGEKRSEILDRIENTSRRMHDIIEKLLDSNAIESGKMELRIESVPLVGEIRHLVQDYQTKAASKNITLHFATEREDLSAVADKHRTVQVIENLLSNAIKFSPANKNVYLSLATTHDAHQHNAHQSVKNNIAPTLPALYISVRDEGPGLSEEDKGKLFGKFVRLSARPTAGEHSTGLGLSIVKKLVEAMRGEIWCESELGQGANFVVKLPMVL